MGGSNAALFVCSRRVHLGVGGTAQSPKWRVPAHSCGRDRDQPANPIIVHPSVPVKTIQELKVYSQANPGKLNCGSAGLGTFTHLICESLKSQAGIDNLHIPYRGGADALNDFLAGVTQIHSEPNGLPHVKSGKGRLLAVADRERHPDYPDVPLVSEVYPDIKIVGWHGLLAPKGTPPEIVNKLNAEIQKIAALSELTPYFLNLALRPVTGSPEQFGALLKEDSDYYAGLVKTLNLKLD